METTDQLVTVSTEEKMIDVEVAFALPQRQVIIGFSVVKGCTALEALQKSGIDRKFPEVDFSNPDLGIFSRPLNGIALPHPDEYILAENDRVEIYRNLLNDPKQARLDRAKKTRTGK